MFVKGLCNHCNEKTITRFFIVEVPSRVFKVLDELEFPWASLISCENERRCGNFSIQTKSLSTGKRGEKVQARIHKSMATVKTSLLT